MHMLHIYVYTYLKAYLTIENIIVALVIIFRIIVDIEAILRTWKNFSSIK